jgi:hypothetical protein
MAITLADVDGIAAKNSLNKQIQRQLLLKIKWFIQYYNSPPNNNPLYDELVLANRTDYIAAKDLVDVLLELDDPRLPSYFGVNNVGEYVGGVVGRASNYPGMSKPSARIAAPDALNVLIDLVEVEFLRAEAKERGYNILVLLRNITTMP